MLALTHSLATSVAVPITGPWPQAFPAKDLCSNCGLCRSTVGVASVTEACAFIGDGMSRAESLEAQVHGRGRQYDEDDLDDAIAALQEKGSSDPLTIKRLKQQKLRLKDMIAYIEDRLYPDIIA